MEKEFILKEIRRIASLNSNVPPGAHKFHNETSIKRHEWLGKYWARWSDALKEAGFTPNQMTEGYKESFLIEKLIELARELGHFPVDSELNIKSFKNKGFPVSRTFARLGSKKQIVSKVMEYCRHGSGFADVLRTCEAASPKTQGVEVCEYAAEAANNLGLVYLIKSGRFYKIGKTNSIGRRVYDLAIQLAEKPTTIHVIKTDDPDGVEAYWHKRFESKRKNGEWFDLSASDVKAFKRWLRIV